MPSKNFKLTRQRIFLGIFVFSIFIVGGFSLVLWKSRTEYIQRSGDNFSTMSLALVEIMDSHLRYATSALEEIDRDIFLGGGLEVVSPEAQHKILRRLADLDQVVGHNLAFGPYFLVNKEGFVTANSFSSPSIGFELKDRDYFQQHVKMPGKQLYISKPTVSRLTAGNVVFITRRISSSDGQFVGIVGVHLSLSYFSDFYRRLGLDGRASIFLGKMDGDPIFRYPNSEKINTTGISGTSAFQEIKQFNHGWISSESPYEATEGVLKIVGFQVSENFPILAIVGNTKETIVGAWLSAVIPQTLNFIVVLLGLGVITFFTFKQLDRLEKVTIEATHDALTGLGNRRELENMLIREWHRARRSASPISLLFIDIDYFKRFNDALGHSEGDRCLKNIAHILQREFQRASDMTARVGGEEMVCLLTDCSEEAALRSAENLLVQVRSANILHPDSPIEKIVTVSIGIATVIPEPTMQWMQLMERADKALYHAKETGRNRASTWIPDMEHRHSPR